MHFSRWVRVQCSIISNALALWYTAAEQILAIGFAYVPFTEFVGDATPESVNAVQLVVDAQLPSLDAQIDMVALTGPAEVNFVFAPEPGALPVGICGWLLAAIGHRRLSRRRRRVSQP